MANHYYYSSILNSNTLIDQWQADNYFSLATTSSQSISLWVYINTENHSFLT